MQIQRRGRGAAVHLGAAGTRWLSGGAVIVGIGSRPAERVLELRLNAGSYSWYTFQYMNSEGCFSFGENSHNSHPYTLTKLYRVGCDQNMYIMNK